MKFIYFLGDKEVVINNLKDFEELYKKGLIGKETAIQDIEKHIYVKVCEVEEFTRIIDSSKYVIKNKGKTGVLQYILAFVLIISALLVRVFGSSLRNNQISANSNIEFLKSFSFGITGIIVLISIVAFVLVYFVSRRNKARNILILSTLFFSINLYLLAVDFKEIKLEKAQNRETIEEFLSVYSNASGERIEEEKISKKNYVNIKYATENMRQFIDECSLLVKNSEKIYTETNVDSMFISDNLFDINKIKESRKTVSDNLFKVKELKLKFQDLYEDVLNNLETANVFEESKDIIGSGIGDGMKEKTAEVGRMFELQEELFERVDKLLKYLEDKQGGYIFINNQLQFYKIEDVENFNKLADEFNVRLEEVDRAYNNLVD